MLIFGENSYKKFRNSFIQMYAFINICFCEYKVTTENVNVADFFYLMRLQIKWIFTNTTKTQKPYL